MLEFLNMTLLEVKLKDRTKCTIETEMIFQPQMCQLSIEEVIVTGAQLKQHEDKLFDQKKELERATCDIQNRGFNKKDKKASLKTFYFGLSFVGHLSSEQI